MAGMSTNETNQKNTTFLYTDFVINKLILFVSVCSAKTKKSATSLSVVSVQATDIPPRETVVYTKQTQTSNTGGVERDGESSLLRLLQLFIIYNVLYFYNANLIPIY